MAGEGRAVEDRSVRRDASAGATDDGCHLCMYLSAEFNYVEHGGGRNCLAVKQARHYAISVVDVLFKDFSLLVVTRDGIR